MLSSVVTSIISILSIFLQYFPIILINICYHFRALQILGKWGSKFGIKRTSFSTLRAPPPTDFWISIVFSHWNACYPDPNKIVDAFLFFSNIFWIICFWLFSFKMWLQNLSKYCHKNWITHYYKIASTHSCSNLLELCVQSSESIVQTVFLLKLIEC